MRPDANLFFGALTLYLNFLNMFLFMVQLLGNHERAYVQIVKKGLWR